MESFALKDYDKVIVDGSIFVNRFPEALAQELSETKYYIAASFGAECACYQMHMTPEQRQVFEDNAAVLKKENANVLPRSENLWRGLINAAAGNESVLLITANLLLIEKIVLRELKLDICNLHEHELEFMPHSKFETYREQYKCWQDQEVESVELFDAESGSLDVYDGNRLYLELKRIANSKDEIKEGLEAYLYEVPAKPSYIAKVFKHKRRSQDKLDHVEALLELNQTRLHCDWAALPEQMVSLDRTGNPLGFLMRRFRDRSTLEEKVAEIKRKIEKERGGDTKMSTVLDWCIMLTTELAYLAVFGLYVTDFSGCNFLMPADDDQDRHISLVDVDSYCYGTYFGGKVDSEVSQWRILDACQGGNKADLVDMSIRLLFAEIFWIITGGFLPYVHWDEYFNDPDVGLMPEDDWMRYIFPGKLLKLMDRVLSKKSLTDPAKAVRIPSLDGLVAVLLQTRDELEAHSPDVTYGELIQWQSEDVKWPVNGLGAPDEPLTDETDAEPEPVKPPKKERRREQKRSEDPRPEHRVVRRPNKNDHFTDARLMGTVIEPEVIPMPQKPQREQISRERVNNWRQEVQQDQKKAVPVKKWLYRGLFLTLLLAAVWLCLFADFELLHQIRQTVLAWVERTAEWWTDEILPLMERTWRHVCSMLPWLRKNT